MLNYLITGMLSAFSPAGPFLVPPSSGPGPGEGDSAFGREYLPQHLEQGRPPLDSEAHNSEFPLTQKLTAGTVISP
jgi:hypothetical protein